MKKYIGTNTPFLLVTKLAYRTFAFCSNIPKVIIKKKAPILTSQDKSLARTV